MFATCLNVHAAGDAAAGAKVFKAECAECHSVREGLNKKGPSLFGVIGRKAASIGDFSYSDALKAKGWTWSEEQLASYISKKSSETNPGTKMKYEGLADPNAIADLTAYLKEVK